MSVAGDGIVEAGIVFAAELKKPDKMVDIVVVNRGGCELGVVDGRGEPAVIGAVAAPFGVAHLFIACVQAFDGGVLGFALFGIRAGTLIDFVQFRAGLADQADEFGLALAVGLVGADALGVAMGAEIFAHPGRLDGHRESLVERRVALHIDALMGEFVKDDAGQIGSVGAEHGAQERIARQPQRGIGVDARNVDVETGVLHPVGLAERVLRIEKSLIGHAAEDGETFDVRGERELGGREDGPGHVIALDVDIAAVAVIVRQVEFGDRELPDLVGGCHAVAQGFGRGGLFDQPLDILPCGHEFQMPVERLRVVGQGGAARHREKGCQRAGMTENSGLHVD